LAQWWPASERSFSSQSLKFRKVLGEV